MGSTLESDWLYSVLRFSLVATSSASSSDDGFDDREPQHEEFHKAILYSRRLMLTYQLVLLTVIANFAARQWLGYFRARYRLRKVEKDILKDTAIICGDNDITNPQVNREDAPDVEISSSSGSSTLEGTDSPPGQIKVLDEETPLLYDGNLRRGASPQRSVLSTLKAFLMYQPRPLPFVNKTLPSNGSTILITAFIALNLFYTLYDIRWEPLSVFVLADRSGLVFVANLPLLYLLAAKTQPLKFLTGYSYESLNIIHRRLGELLCFEALLHFLGMAATWYTILRPSGRGLWQFLTSKVIVLGLGAFIAYELLYFTALGSFRARWYEVFLALHVSLQVAGLVLVFFHHTGGRINISLALAIFLIDRLVYRFGLKSFTTTATIQVMDDGETILVSALIPLRESMLSRRIFGRSILDGWHASDHIFISVPALGRTHVLQAHPFTIISPAPSGSPSNDPTSRNYPTALSLLIRAQSGFSASLLQYALERHTLTICLDGPYGSPHARSLLSTSDVAILIAGGSGISVAWPLLHHLLPAAATAAAAATVPPRKIILIWIIHSRLHASWLPTPAIQDLQARPNVTIIIPAATAEASRPDLPALITNAVHQTSASASAAVGARVGTRTGTGQGLLHARRARIGVVASGPDGLARVVRNTCAGLVRRGWDLGLEIEKFGW